MPTVSAVGPGHSEVNPMVSTEVMIAALSPAEFNYEETLSTLLPLGAQESFSSCFFEASDDRLACE